MIPFRNSPLPFFGVSLGPRALLPLLGRQAFEETSRPALRHRPRRKGGARSGVDSWQIMCTGCLAALEPYAYPCRRLFQLHQLLTRRDQTEDVMVFDLSRLNSCTGLAVAQLPTGPKVRCSSSRTELVLASSQPGSLALLSPLSPPPRPPWSP